MARRAWIVVDLGFGDSGKGTTTDFLVRQTGARWVIRYNGGAQAGHNVVTEDGRHHTFSQFGSGTFVRGAKTYLTSRVVVHPSALLFEERRLQSVGIDDAVERLWVSGDCRVTTPFHQAAGRIRELARADSPHGTCGVGVGETVHDAFAHPADALCVKHLQHSDRELLRKLEVVRQRLVHSLELGPIESMESMELADLDEKARLEREILLDGSVSKRWLTLIEPIRRRLQIAERDGRLLEEVADSDLVFEGAQGVLLDEWFGFHPHTTWSTCTSEWAEEWLDQSELTHERVRLGVIRAYATRHGPGPMVAEASELKPLLPEPHNEHHDWQGRFRVGWPSPFLTRYAIRANRGVDGLCVTHLDRLRALPRMRFASHLENIDRQFFDGASRDLRIGSKHDLDYQRALGRALEASRPVLSELSTNEESDYLAWLEDSLDVPITLVSRGPASVDKAWRHHVFKKRYSATLRK